MIEIKKNYDQTNIAERILIEKGFAKAIDTPAGMRVSGQLLPDQIEATITGLIDRSEFLKKIYTDNINGTTCDLNDYAASERGTVRPTGGAAQYTDTKTNISNIGTKLTLKRNQEYYFLHDDVLQEKASDLPAFESMLMNIFMTQGSNNLADLAFNGIDDDYGSSLWTKLNKGFPTLFAADTTVNDVVFATYADPIALFEAMVKKLPAKYTMKGEEFFVSKTTYEAYQAQIAATDASGAAYQKDFKPAYFNRNINLCEYLADGQAILTLPKNLAVIFDKKGLNVEVERRATAGGSDIVMNYMSDFGYFNGERVVFAS